MKRLRTGLLPHHLATVQTMLLLVCSFVIFTSQAFAVTRLIDRSVLVYDPEPGVTTKYAVSFTYNTQATVGSVDMLFCYDPIPTDPCVAPAGLDVSQAALADQTGETGFSLTQRSANHLVISRTPSAVGNTPSVYTFDNIVNPTVHKAFSIRLSDYASTDASGALIDLGSVITNVNESLTISTQVPPMLMFCVAHMVSEDCSSQTGGNFTDMGDLSPSQTLTATSQMAAGTNASSGYVITVNGTTMQAGTSVISALAAPTVSAPGNSQFGLNLRANTTPAIGGDPDGSFTNAMPTANYDNPDEFMFHDGDVVASAPNVSLIRRFTVSYIVNVRPDLRAGVYTTTLTYICSGRF